jgi:hypothetical protein
VSTITTERPDVTAAHTEWRRICHCYEDDSLISVCGTAKRRPGEYHLEPECRARGHAICVVCREICASNDFRS